MDSDDGMTHPGSAHALGSPDVPPAQRGELRGEALYIWGRDFIPGIIPTLNCFHGNQSRQPSVCLSYLGLVRRGETRRITVNTLLIILWSSILKTETMEINMSLAVVNMFPQQFNIKIASNGTICNSYIISLFSVRIITPSRETDIWQIWIMKGWTGACPSRVASWYR